LFFIFLIIWKRVDYGPMYHAEVRARNAHSEGEDTSLIPGDIDEIPDNKEHIWNAILPIVIMIVSATMGLLYTGIIEVGWSSSMSFGKNLSSIIGSADSYSGLIWGSFIGLVSAIGLTVGSKVLSLKKTMEMAENGVKSMMPAILILTMAWSLGAITEKLHTAEYLAELTKGNIMPQLLPTVVFVLSAAIAFSTGTSWGTMSILYPIVLVTSWNICQAAGISIDLTLGIFANVVSAVLAGSVLGDHCSPISDTTILSSLSADCDHVAHVRTQMPYALTVGGISILFGTLPAGFGVPFYITMPIAAIVVYFTVSYLGKMVDNKGLQQQ